MQLTIKKYNLMSTSKMNRWLFDPESHVFFEENLAIKISNYSWNCRFIIASAIYFNAIEFIPDDIANDIIATVISKGDEAGQEAIAPVFQALYEIDNDDIPSPILGRCLSLTNAIDWTTISPYSDGSMPEEKSQKVRNTILSTDQKVLAWSQYPDGDFDFLIPATEPNILIDINSELLMIKSAFADSEGMYFSDEKLLKHALEVSKNYIQERYNYNFSITQK